MKGLMLGLVGAIVRLFHRFRDAAPANPYEQIAFGAIRSALAVAFFPPGMEVKHAHR